MRIRVGGKLVRGTLRWVQRFLFTSAALLLGYCGVVVVDTWIFQKREKRALEHLLESKLSPTPSVAIRGLIGRLEIPRLGLAVVFVEGDDAKTLRRAVG